MYLLIHVLTKGFFPKTRLHFFCAGRGGGGAVVWYRSRNSVRKRKYGKVTDWSTFEAVFFFTEQKITYYTYMWVTCMPLQNVTGKAKTKGLFRTIKRLNINQITKSDNLQLAFGVLRKTVSAIQNKNLAITENLGVEIIVRNIDDICFLW